MKPRIAIIYSGQMRTNSLGTRLEGGSDTAIVDSTRRFLLTPEFTDRFDYDVFISTDNLDVRRTMTFFGDAHVKNIHLSDTDFKLVPYPAIPEFEGFLNKYTSIDFVHKPPFTEQLIQYHRVLDTHAMIQSFCGSHPDGGYTYAGFIKLRPDLELLQDMVPLVRRVVETDEIDVMMERNLLWVCKAKYLEALTIIRRYGSYTKLPPDPAQYTFLGLSPFGSLECLNFCSEKQCLDDIIFLMGETFPAKFSGIVHPTYTCIKR